MISPERLDGLQRGFARLMEGYGVEPARAYPVFDRLVAAYEEPHRFYHTLEHVAEVLRVASRLGGSPEVMLAVWFHDAVYDPRRNDNEVNSALMATTELQSLDFDEEVSVNVVAMIAATDIHTASPDGAWADIRILLDADLAILGAAPARYERYAADIRKEFAHVPDAEFARGRLAILRRFLDRPAIYYDPRMSEGEAAARDNIAAECDRLEAAIAAG